MLKTIILQCTILAAFALPASGQVPADEVKARVDAVIAKAYESASARFPCKLKTRGKPKMLRWQDISKCLNYANDLVDWEDISRQLQKTGRDFGLPAADVSALAEASLAAHALPYDKVFIVKQKDMNAFLPLSSSLLKFLPEGSLEDLPVFEKSGKQVGIFSGIYSFEKTGEFSGGRSRLVLFQYTDPKGKVHGSPDRLLLDSFGVPWKGAVSQPGFRLPADRIH